MKIKVEGLESVLDKLDAIDSAHRDKAYKDGLGAGGAVAIKEAKTLVPVESGDLRDNLHVGGYTQLTPGYRRIGAYGELKKPLGRGRTAGVLIGTKLPYAHLVELGSVHNRRRPFLKPAVDRKQREIAAEVDRAIQKIIDKAG